jgi:hypothetical protein
MSSWRSGCSSGISANRSLCDESDRPERFFPLNRRSAAGVPDPVVPGWPSRVTLWYPGESKARRLPRISGVLLPQTTEHGCAETANPILRYDKCATNVRSQAGRMARPFDRCHDKRGCPALALFARAGTTNACSDVLAPDRALGTATAKRNLTPTHIHTQPIAAPAPLFRRQHKSPFHWIVLAKKRKSSVHDKSK